MSNGTALVTGASSGIGAVYADRLARRGHDLILVARDAGRLTDLSKRISQDHGVRAEVLKADLGTADGVARVVQRMANTEGLTMLVNSAGAGPRGSFLASQPAGLSEMVDLNVCALHDLTVAAAQKFSARKRGAIINIASVVALMPERFNATYVATKAFVLGLTQALISELAANEVRIQAVLPGFTRTEIFDRAGVGIHVIDPSMLMEAGEMVDAAMAGFDQGDTVTIPSLQDLALWEAMEAARRAMAPHLSLQSAAMRFGVQPR